MKKLLKNKKGFTLIELIVVIAILAILAAILIPSITNYISRATEAKDSANSRALYSQYAMEYVTADPAITDDDYTYGDDSECDVTVADGAITVFTCTYGSKTYGLPDFAPEDIVE